MPAEQLEALFQVIEGGVQTAAENVIQFPVDAVGSAAETSLAGEGISTAAQLGNGAAAEVSQLTATGSGAATATTTGLGLLAIDVGAAGAAVAPALGILAGVGLYNLAPEFWTNVSERLAAAGQTVGGKVRTFLNSNTKQMGLSETTIEIFKNAFLEAGLFVQRQEATSDLTSGSITQPIAILSSGVGFYDQGTFFNLTGAYDASSVLAWKEDEYYFSARTLYASADNTELGNSWTYKNKTVWYRESQRSNVLKHNDFQAPSAGYVGGRPYTDINSYGKEIAWTIIYGDIESEGVVQPGATVPGTNPFPNTYPNWLPWQAPQGVPWPSALPNIYPIEAPDLKPDINQNQAQNPDPNPEPDPWLQWILDNIIMPEPVPDPAPVPPPSPDPDPDPQPVPVPIPVPIDEEIERDPIDPNPVPVPGPIPIIPIIPETVDSNAMFTVYRPSLSQLNAFGGWLWDNSIVEQILRMWQNPLDGIITLMKVYANPTVGATRTIQVGYLASSASAPVVTSQFVTVDCGTVSVAESKHNATDYSPYVSLHLYLPFIGIVELDPNEFMNGSISVKYHIDVYTGTCLAEVKSTRSPDMPNATIIYTFSGNAAQQLPLTSSNFAGALSSLVSAVGGGIMIASGGAVGGVAGAAALGHSLTHEMVHVGHSGALSANAGIMASRIPYIIIGRRHGYDANGYNELYGYPVNKTVFLGNCSGYTRVKACRLKSKASENEKQEIEALLKKGVIL